MSKKTFVKGAAVLGIAGLMVQVLGAAFRIPLGNIIGDEGMGYYQTAYPIYIFLLVFSTNGAPAAISKMTSERIAVGRHEEAHRVFRVAFLLMGAVGLAASSVLFFGARPLVELMKNTGAYYCMAAIAPALLVVPVMSVYRGYFQGMQNMGPTAVSQLIEQAVRVAVGLSLAVLLVPSGMEIAAAGATVGTSIGPVAGLIALWVIYRKRRGEIHRAIEAEWSERPREETAPQRERGRTILKTLIWIAIPITIGVSIMPLMNLADALLVMNRMQGAGFTEAEANALFGQLAGMAGPVVNLPMALALSMALSMVPAAAAAKSAGDEAFLQVNVKLGLRTSMIIGVPCSFGLMALARPIMRLLYPLQAESAVNASASLFFLSTGIIFLCVAQTMAGILQGIGRPGFAVYGLLCGLGVKCAATWVLAAVPEWNINGAAAGSSLGFCAIGLFNFFAVRRFTKIRFDWMLSAGKPLLSGALMYGAVLLLYKGTSGILGNSLATLLSVGAGAAVYGVALVKGGAIRAEEIKMFPKGDRLEKLLRKLRLI